VKHFLAVICPLLLLPMAGWTTEPSPSSESDQAEVVRGNNAFAVELYGQLRGQAGNLFFSPETISTALAMTYAGARGGTAAEMAKVLHFTLPQERLHPAMAFLLRDLNGSVPRSYQLCVANALWMQQGYTFLDDFLKVTKDHYGAGLNTVDFVNGSEQARQTINQWVEQQTQNKIENLVQPGVLSKYTRLVLTNAVYFRGDWQTQFGKARTEEDDFHVTPTEKVRVPLMHREGEFNYFDGGTFQALEIPYSGKELSMIVFLPNAVDGLPAFEQSMAATTVEEWIGKLRPTADVQVNLPKFKVTAQFQLNDVLSRMGMRQAFDSRMAAFNGMAPSEMLKREPLYISAVIHKAYVDVNEEGTEAAAATASLEAHATAIVAGEHPPPVFRADHPFVFVIRENRTGSILFMGRVTDPLR
jgi:serpin B